MAIRLITGVPGSGKTYFFVHHVWKKYFKNPDVLVCHNIDGLEFGRDIRPDIERAGGINTLFTVDKFKDYVEYLKEENPHKNLVICLDECQQYFPRRSRPTKDVLFFFQWHRHLELDIWLITQDFKNIHREIYDLVENHFNAAPRSVFPLFNTYAVRIAGQKVSTKFLLKRNEVYELYNGVGQGEIDQPKSFFLLRIVVILFIVVGSILYFRYSFGLGENTDQPATVEQTEKKKTSSVPLVTDEDAPQALVYEWRRIDSVIIYREPEPLVMLPSGLTGSGPFIPSSDVSYPIKAEKQGRLLVFYGLLPIFPQTVENPADLPLQPEKAGRFVQLASKPEKLFP